MILKAQLTS